MFNFDEANNKSREAVDTFVKGYTTVAQGMQAIATETADYSKKSLENNLAHFEKLSGIRSIEAAVELQTAFVKSSYEGFVAEATKLTGMYADLAKGVYKPYEAPVARTATAAKASAVAA